MLVGCVGAMSAAKRVLLFHPSILLRRLGNERFFDELKKSFNMKESKNLNVRSAIGKKVWN